MRYAASIGDQVASLVGDIVTIALKVAIFLAIMLLGWFVATWLYRWVGRLLRRVGFDRAVERGGLHRLIGDASASDLTARLVMFAFMLFVLQLAFGIFGPNPVSVLIADVVAWLPKLFVAVVIVVVTAAIGGWVRDLIRRSLGGVSYGGALGVAAQSLIVALGVIAALNQIGIGASVTLPVLITALATIGGILVVGLGGGLVKPMQHRWERILHRAEAETTTAAERVRANRAEARGHNERFGQPAYPGPGPGDTKPMPDRTAGEPAAPGEESGR